MAEKKRKRRKVSEQIAEAPAIGGEVRVEIDPDTDTAAAWDEEIGEEYPNLIAKIAGEAIKRALEVAAEGTGTKRAPEVTVFARYPEGVPTTDDGDVAEDEANMTVSGHYRIGVDPDAPPEVQRRVHFRTVLENLLYAAHAIAEELEWEIECQIIDQNDLSYTFAPDHQHNGERATGRPGEEGEVEKLIEPEEIEALLGPLFAHLIPPSEDEDGPTLH